MKRIFLIEDDEIMAECLARNLENGLKTKSVKVATFTNAIDAINALAEGLPDLIFLDILLSGPDGFSFLNELISYQDTMRIPVVIVSSLDFSGKNLSHYGVRRVLQKETMLPNDVVKVAEELLADENLNVENL